MFPATVQTRTSVLFHFPFALHGPCPKPASTSSAPARFRWSPICTADLPPRAGPRVFQAAFQGRCNVLMLIAAVDERPAGFFIGFELKPTVYFAWFYGVLPTQRRQGIASQLMDATHAWCVEQGYESIRFECQTSTADAAPAIARTYDIVGIRWDPDRGENLVIFEKSLMP